jgi:hypothetical protein
LDLTKYQVDTSKGKKYAAELLAMDPRCIPGMCYQYFYEDDQAKKAKYRAKLVDSYSEHWMVVRILEKQD